MYGLFFLFVPYKTIHAIGICILEQNSNLHFTKKLIDSVRKIVNVIKIRGIHLVQFVHSNTKMNQSCGWRKLGLMQLKIRLYVE